MSMWLTWRSQEMTQKHSRNKSHQSGKWRTWELHKWFWESKSLVTINTPTLCPRKDLLRLYWKDSRWVMSNLHQPLWLQILNSIEPPMMKLNFFLDSTWTIEALWDLSGISPSVPVLVFLMQSAFCHGTLTGLLCNTGMWHFKYFDMWKELSLRDWTLMETSPTECLVKRFLTCQFLTAMPIGQDTSQPVVQPLVTSSPWLEVCCCGKVVSNQLFLSCQMKMSIVLWQRLGKSSCGSVGWWKPLVVMILIPPYFKVTIQEPSTSWANLGSTAVQNT